MSDRNVGDTGQGDSLIQRLLHIIRSHGGAELPAQDKPRIIIQYRGQVIPTPANHFKIDKIRLSQLVNPSGRGMKRITRR